MEDEPDPGQMASSLHPDWSGVPLLALLLSASSPTALLLGAGGCFLLAFLFAIFETALQEFSRVRLSAAARKRGTEDAIDVLLLREDEILFASKVGRGLLQTAGIALGVVAIVGAAPQGLQAAVWATLLALFVLLFLVGTSYILGRHFADEILLRWLLPYSRFVHLVFPISNALQKIVGRFVGRHHETDPAEEIADEILSAVEEGAREGTIEHSEKRMIEGIIDLREVTADHIMTPRTEMVSVPVDASATDAIDLAADRGLSRLPVYRETPDEIIGILYVKDLLPYLGKDVMPTVATICHKPFFIPQSKNVGELLQEMRQKRVHLAIVLDEYGGTAGVATIEDILEEIVGEIEDEHEADRARDEVVRLGENSATVEGRTHIDDLNRSLDLDVPESEEYETVGGFLFARMGRVPSVGEHYDVDGVRFTILAADERRINRVKVAVQAR